MGLNNIKSKDGLTSIDLCDFDSRDLADHLQDIEYPMVDHLSDIEITDALDHRFTKTELLEFISEKDIIEYAIDNIKNADSDDQGYMADQLCKEVIESAAEDWDLLTDIYDEESQIQALCDIAGLNGGTTLEVLWAEKKIRDLCEEVSSFEYLDVVKCV